MITVTIGDIEKLYEDATPNWINDQINRRRRDGVPICVKVSIRTDSIKMALSTPACAGGGGGRLPSENERRIFDLWDKLHLNSDKFTGGNLVAFLKQVANLI